MSKAFVISFTEALHEEYNKQGIKMIAVSAGTTDTGFFDDGGVAYGTKRAPRNVVQTDFKGLKKAKYRLLMNPTICSIALCYQEFSTTKEWCILLEGL